MEARTKVIPLKLSDNMTILVEARTLGGEEDVSSKFLSFKPVTDAIEAIATQVDATVSKIKPNKVSIEFGLEVTVKSGELLTLLVSGEKKGNVKITMEWEDKS